MEAKDLRKKKEELQNKVQELMSEFVNEVGECNISVDVRTGGVRTFGGEDICIHTIVNINVTI